MDVKHKTDLNILNKHSSLRTHHILTKESPLYDNTKHQDNVNDNNASVKAKSKIINEIKEAQAVQSLLGVDLNSS